MLTVSLFFFFFFSPFRYGVNDHILTHKLVQHAIQLPPSFDPIAPRKYNMIFLVSKEVCIPLFGICFVLRSFLLSALLVSTVAWWSPCWTSDWKVWVRVLLQSLLLRKTHSWCSSLSLSISKDEHQPTIREIWVRGGGWQWTSFPGRRSNNTPHYLTLWRLRVIYKEWLASNFSPQYHPWIKH